MKIATYIIALTAVISMASGVYAEPMNDEPQVQGTPSGAAGGPNTGGQSAVQPAQPAGAEHADQGKAPADTMNKKSDEAVDAEEKGKTDKLNTKKAEQQNPGDAQEAGRDNAKHAAEPRKGDRAADRDGKDQQSERNRSRVSLDSGQRTKIQTYFRDHRPRGHRVERSAVSVSLGFAVPSTIILAPMPAEVIVVSAACPIQYFVWADDLVLVDSCSREVIDIIPGAA